MKILACLLFTLFCVATVNSQDAPALADSTDLPPQSIRVIAKVIHADYDYMTIVVEHVVAYGRGTSTTPQTGEQIPVRLPGRDKPETERRIEVDLKEKIDVGAMPTSYIMLGYRTID